MKKVIYSLVAIAAFSGISTNASAEWTVIDTNTGITSYVDKGTIHKEENIVVMSTLDDLALPNKFREGFYHSTIWQEGYDCAKKTHRVINSTFYEERMGKGNVLASFGPTQQWEKIQPNSASEALWKIACDIK
ncbi:MAG: hypothetical protein EPN14_01675 [Gallionella sp.]|nr:MAG: hypothetical protein EPN14_01675 [Gallionella sp.]